MTISQIPDLLSTREAAAILGVGASSIKRWADQGLLACVKTAGGHRRFARAVVEAFRDALAQGAAGSRSRGGDGNPPGTVDGGVGHLPGRSGLVDDVEVSAAALHRAPSAAALLGPFESALLEALLVGESPQAIEARLLRARGELGAWGPVADRVGEMLTELGRRWSDGRVSIVDEHLASERLARALSRVVEWLPAPPGGPQALLVAAQGDDHTLGLLLVEVCLRELGWSTMMVGRSTPIAETIRTVLESRPPIRLVAVSASSASHDAAALAAESESLGAACRAVGATFVVGGGGAWPDKLRYGHRVNDLGRLRRLASLAEVR